jgi:hypothetical protein
MLAGLLVFKRSSMGITHGCRSAISNRGEEERYFLFVVLRFHIHLIAIQAQST